MIYSELRSEADLFNDLEDTKSVFILGCPACSNSSLYIQKAAEGSAMLTPTPTGLKAVPMIEEVNRLTRLLADKGLVVDSWVGEYPTVSLCVLSEFTCKEIIEKCQDFEAVVTLCCNAGKKSVEGILPGKSVIAGMNDRGIATAIIKEQTDSTHTLYIDKSTVNITQFTVET